MLMHTDVPVTGTQTFLFVEMRSRTMYHLLLSCHPPQQAAFLVPPGLFAGINPRGGRAAPLRTPSSPQKVKPGRWMKPTVPSRVRYRWHHCLVTILNEMKWNKGAITLDALYLEPPINEWAQTQLKKGTPEQLALQFIRTKDERKTVPGFPSQAHACLYVTINDTGSATRERERERAPILPGF
jgi:hypothetical protein